MQSMKLEPKVRRSVLPRGGWIAALVLLGSLVAEPVTAQFINGDFESGDFTGWTLEYGKNLTGTITSWSTTLPTGHPVPTIVTASAPLQPGQTLAVAPYQGTQMARINDIAGGDHATRLTQTTPVTAAALSAGGSVLVDWGAMLVEPSSGHGPTQMPFFSIQVFAGATLLDEFKAVASDASLPGSGWVAAGTSGGTLWYRRGTFCTSVADLPIGTDITVQMVVADCSLGAHGGFAYLDDVRFGNCCVFPPLGMTGWWPLEGNGKDIALSDDGVPTGGLVTTSGEVGDAYDFDGSSGEVDVPNPAGHVLDVRASNPGQAVNGDFSVDAWIRADSLKEVAVVVSKWACIGDEGNQTSDTCPGTGYSFGLADDRLHLFMDAPFKPVDFVSDEQPVLDDQQWHLIAVTVDRDAVGGVRFYLDGELIGPGTLDPTVIPESLSNSGEFTIGTGITFSSTGEPHFDGAIDEVEFFQRCVTASEIQAIFKAGPAGKCTTDCYFPSILWFEPGQASLTCKVLVCNFTTAPRTFKLTATGSIANGPCAGPTPTGFSYPSGQIVTVPAQSVGSLPIVISRPAGLSGCMKSPFIVTVVDQADDDAHVCQGQLGDFTWLLAQTDNLPFGFTGPGNLATVHFQVGNPGPFPNLVDWQIAAVAIHGPDSAGPGVSLNGQAPGVPLSGAMMLGPGQDATITAQAEVTDLLPFGLYEIGLYVDADGDGVKDLVASMPLLPVLPGKPCTALPGGAVAWWPFDETSDPMPDLVGGHVAHPHGAVQTGLGVVGPALVLEGPDEFVQVADDPALDPGPGAAGSFSIEGWVSTAAASGSIVLVDKLSPEGPPSPTSVTYQSGKTTGASTGGSGSSPATGRSGTASAGYVFLLDQGRLSLILRDGPSPPLETQFDSGVFVADGGWHHVAVTVDRSSATGGHFYVDGLQAGASFDPLSQPGSLASTAPLRMGRAVVPPGQPSSRSLDEITIYSRALTPAEVASMAAASYAGKCK